MILTEQSTIFPRKKRKKIKRLKFKKRATVIRLGSGVPNLRL